MKYVLGSRGSALALAQVELFQEAFREHFPSDEVAVEVVRTTGDKKQGTPEAAVSDKREWIHELEEGVVRGELSFALHCGKDVPCEIHPETILLPVLARAEARDLFLGRLREEGSSPLGERVSFRELKQGDRVGTASERRTAQLQRLAPALTLQELRGNVHTRIAKLDRGEVDGIVLAAAGIERLKDLSDLSYELFSPDELLPALNQGSLAVQLRRDAGELLQKLSSLSSEEHRATFRAERRVAERLEGDCHSAIGIFGELTAENTLHLRAEVFGIRPGDVLFEEAKGPIDQALILADTVAERLIVGGAPQLLAERSEP
ncbi:hydroxymethylbilane synthase [bacterium]|nr:hydroxymethylbilane synthase [bacterium]